MKIFRDKNGRFSRKWLHVVFYTLAIILIFIFAYVSKFNGLASAEENKVLVMDTTSEIINGEKNNVLDTLRDCESTNDTERINWDDYGVGKNRASFGAYQLKVGTIQHYLPKLTDFQSILLAYNEPEARKFSEMVIFDNDGIINWKNCMIKHNLQERVKFIKQLQEKYEISNKNI